MAEQPTGFDVARAAGVSQPTVSRALRNLPGVSPETRRRVLEAARALAYVPSDSGRVLSTRSTQRVAVVSDSLTNPYYPELVEPLRRYLGAAGFRMVLLSDADTRSDAGVADALADGAYDGVVLTTTLRRSSLPRDLTERRVPHVLVNRVLDHAESPSATVDNVRGSFLAADLLVELGHERVGTLQGPVETSTGKERGQAFADRLRMHGVGVRRAWFGRCAFSHDSGFDAASRLLASPDRPTALVCGNDVIALGALSAARELRIAVPDELTIVGFDDIPMAGWPMVDLTTVRCDLDRLAREAVELLMASLEHGDASLEVRRVPVELVRRSTHGGAPGAALV